MCELFGVSSTKKIALNSYLKEFANHSRQHPHGWGMATFFGDAVNLEKEPIPAHKSFYLKSRVDHNLEADTMIAHIRLATRGRMVYENCHPFVRRDLNGRAWTLAHNGTLFDSHMIDAYKEEEEGDTDSEGFLLHILHSMNAAIEAGEEMTWEKRCQIMDHVTLELTPHNKLNYLLYDGELFYVHTNMRGTLHYCRREEGILFATSSLSDESWEPLPFMQLLVYKDGKCVFEGTAHENEYILEQ